MTFWDALRTRLHAQFAGYQCARWSKSANDDGADNGDG